jgi:hypothetical protein
MKRALIALTLLLGACAPWLTIELSRSADHVRVPHATHAGAKVECISCHEEIYDAKDLHKRVLPDEGKCLECHREQKEKGRCSMCHTDVSRAAPWPPAEPAVRMSHAAHIERVKEKCETCHTELPNPLRGARQAPTMQSCLGCHEHQREYDEGRCNGCHIDLLRRPLSPATTFSHQGDFVRQHARPARAAGASCQSCHDQTFCSDCHSSTVATKIEWQRSEDVAARFIHRNDFLGRHAVEAAADGASCRRCHGSSFCESCHRAQNLTANAANPRDPHPPGWAFPGAAQFHGTAARRDITSCAGCHDQGARSICVDCHRVGGIGGNPHPLGWSARHGRDEIGRNGMCLACHL